MGKEDELSASSDAMETPVPLLPLVMALQRNVQTRLEPCAAEMKLDDLKRTQREQISYPQRHQGFGEPALVSFHCSWHRPDILWCCFPPWVDLFNFHE